MSRVILFTIVVAVAISYNSASALIATTSKLPSDRHLFATKNDDSSGAGAWRAKAKEFQDNPEGFADSDKKLNIAFVVSSICMYTYYAD